MTDGIERIALHTPWSSCVLAPFGGQVLQFAPHGAPQVFWMTPRPRPLPAPIRGGVPLCWPWFARQGVAPEAPQHGSARTARWRIAAIVSSNDGEQSVLLEPDLSQRRLHASDSTSEALAVSLRLRIGRVLHMELVTRNVSAAPQPLTQALHNYFAVADVFRARIEGLEGAAYIDSRAGGAPREPHGAFSSPAACDRIYHGFAGDPTVVLVDERDGRAIRVQTSGCRSIVVWNPGADRAAGLADVPEGDWTRFVCIEPANAGPDARVLAPGETHVLAQTIEALAV